MTTLAIIAPGAMGSAIARRVRQHGARVLTSLQGRSAASIARAGGAGMENAGERELIEQADFFLSIVPPRNAGMLADRFASLIAGASRAPIYIDCNAISVPEAEHIARVIERAGGRCVDGSIIGSRPGMAKSGRPSICPAQANSNSGRSRTSGLWSGPSTAALEPRPR